MRTTLEIDDAVLAAARAMADAEKMSLGAAVSALARRGLALPADPRGARIDVAYSEFPVLMGDPDHLVTPDIVAAHRDD